MSFLARLFSRNSPTSRSDGMARPTAEVGRWATPAGQATELRIEGGLATDPGCVREINEDCARIIRPTTPAALQQRGVLAVVCDGMGGHEAGEIASRLAVETIVRRFEDDELAADPVAAVPRSVQAANRAIFDAAARNEKMRGMGTTCTVLLLRDGMAYGAHVGDSRIYLIRGGEIFLMTEDHSAVMELVRRGVISRDEARHHPDKNVISRALGGHREVQVTGWPRPFAMRPGDRFLLCTDGLYDLVEDGRLLDIARDVHPQVACDRLITLAREAGGHDNISVAILAMSEMQEPASAGPRETRAIEVPQ